MSDQSQGLASVVTQFVLLPEAGLSFGDEMVAVALALQQTPGYVGSDIHTDATGVQVTGVLRFSSVSAARTWLSSPFLAESDARMEPHLRGGLVRNLLLPTGAGGSATSLINTRVKTGFDDWFLDWQGRMGAVQSRFPGYAGQQVQAPIPGVSDHWVTIVAFDTEADLDRWNGSAERFAMLEESEPYVEHYDVRPAASAFESWFSDISRDGPPPAAWKLSAIVLLVLYPVVMLEIFSLNQLSERVLSPWATHPVTVALGVFIGNAVSVAVTGFLLIPWASRQLEWWLVPADSVKARVAKQGGLVVGMLYAISVLLFAFIIWAVPSVMSWVGS